MSTQIRDVTQSKTLYNIEHWSEGYFDINPQGEITVSPIPKQPNINLYKLAQSLCYKMIHKTFLQNSKTKHYCN